MPDIPSHIGPVVLRPWHGADADAWIATPGDLTSARLWLVRSIGEDSPAAGLRLAALALADGTDLSRLDDHQLVDHLAAASATGWLRTPVVRVELFKLVRTSIQAPASPPSAGAPSAASTESQAAPDNTFDSGRVAAGMAEVLVRAAQDGVPFLEECVGTAVAEAS